MTATPPRFRIPLWYEIAGSATRIVPLLLSRGRLGFWTTARNPTVWLHAASLGETKGLLRLAEVLDDTPLTLTATTVSGLARLRAQRPDLESFLLPWDEESVVRRFLKSRQVRCAIFLEAELWPCILQELARADIPAALASARSGPRSHRNWNRLRAYFPGITETLSVVWVDGPSTALEGCGFRHLLDGASLKWAGVRARKSSVVPHRAAALSLHLRDLLTLRKLVRRAPGKGWYWFPRRIWMRPIFRFWARFLGLRSVPDPSKLAPGKIWIAPRFGLVNRVVPGCSTAWVSPGHDRIEPIRLGVPELMQVEQDGSGGNLPTPEGTREAIAAWARSTARGIGYQA
jgi:hypothetical protein